MSKREDAMREIRELGTIPMSELKAYEKEDKKKILKLLNNTSEGLKKYSHVNKKALDQYVSFHEQRSTLLDRKQELDHGKSSIEELIGVLDRKKDEAILRTFKGVSHHFGEVFEELVPTGNGKMVILRNSTKDDSQDSSEEGNGSSSNGAVDTFSGVQIKVDFRGEGDAFLMQQLSGGQKALVALAFIFAIQRSDPAPFYLLDEIDQALDATHRAAVAALIRRQAHATENGPSSHMIASESTQTQSDAMDTEDDTSKGTNGGPTQFITSTFRPEMVQVADRCYGISHQHKISSVHVMKKNEALEFIANIMAEEEAVEDKTRDGNSAKRSRKGKESTRNPVRADRP